MSQDSGVLSERQWQDSYDPNCDYDYQIDVDAICAVTAHGTSSEDWDQIAQDGSNIWRFDFHFADRPKEMIGHCTESEYESWWAEPWNFELKAEIQGDEDSGQLYFESEAPQNGDDDSSNDEYEKALDILGGVGGTYTKVGAAIGKYLLRDSGSAFHSHDNESVFHWDLSLSGEYSDLPHDDGDDEINAVQTSMRVRNEYKDGTHGIKYTPSYTFSYIEWDAEQCACSRTYRTYATTAPHVSGYADYEAVE
jgi:hypothetical protein